MKYMVFLMLTLGATDPMEINFGQNNETGYDWRIVNDGVMGGLSTSAAMLDDNSLLFEGKVSLENNGGFASIRSPYGDYDLSAYTTVKIRCRGGGQQIAFSLVKEPQWYLPNYKALFSPTEEWQVFEFELTEFAQYKIGRKTGNKLSESTLSQIIQMNFITMSKKASDFTLEVDWIRFE